MEIKTEFNIGDEIFFMNKNKVKSAKVIHIHLNVSENHSAFEKLNIKIQYHINKSDLSIKLFEEEAFKTKQELLESL